LIAAAFTRLNPQGYETSRFYGWVTIGGNRPGPLQRA